MYIHLAACCTKWLQIVACTPKQLRFGRSKNSKLIECQCTFENKLQFYNVVTPNDDRKNDYFVIETVQLYPGNELSIYNRWGTEVLRKKDYDNTWDGKNQSSGTYYYLLKLSNGTSYKGWVEIIK